jgi:hypothetical protein
VSVASGASSTIEDVAISIGVASGLRPRRPRSRRSALSGSGPGVAAAAESGWKYRDGCRSDGASARAGAAGIGLRLLPTGAALLLR